MMNEENLIKISHSIDDFLMEIINTYDINFLNLSAMVLARLSRLSSEMNEKESLTELMASTLNMMIDHEETVENESKNFH